MCMITTTPAGVGLPIEGILNGAISNNDGHGWAVASRDGLEVGKSMDYEVSIDAYEEARKRHGASSIGLFHSRWATHGITSEFNIHPFFVDQSKQTVVAHNGVLPYQYHPNQHDPRSDTRIFVDRVLGGYTTDNGIPSRRGAKRLSSLIGSGNKLAFLSVASGEPRLRIVNAYLGDHSQGSWFSNSGYLPSRWSKYNHLWDDWDPIVVGRAGGIKEFIDGEIVGENDEKREYEWKDWLTCKVCESFSSVEPDVGVCEMCNVCNDCMTDYDDCLCYRGSHFEQFGTGFKTSGHYSWDH